LILSLITFALVPLSFSAAPGSSRFAIEVKDARDGLPHPSVIAMTQTRDGYLWLGTLNGLVRYDGFSFRVFDENNTPGLNSSQIVYLFEDSRRVLWIGTETAGIVMLKDGQVMAPPELALGGAERKLVAACEDAEGAVWLYNVKGEIWRHQAGRLTPFVLLPIRTSLRRTMIAEEGGPVWIGTDSRQFAAGRVQEPPLPGLPIQFEVAAQQLEFLLASKRGGYWRFDGGTIQRWKSTNRMEGPSIPYPWGQGRWSMACEDLAGNLVVGTLGAGVFLIDPQGQHTRLSTADGLSHDHILSLAVDHEGTLWVGTDGGGLNRVKRKAFHTLPVTHGSVVQSVAEDADGIWIASNNHSVGHWNNEVFTPDPRIPADASTRCVLVDRQQRVYLGTPGGGLFLRQRGAFFPVVSSVPVNPHINVLHQSRSGLLSIGTDGGLVQMLDGQWKLLTTAQGLSADAITAVAEDPTNGLWIGTRGGGLNFLRDERVTIYRKKDRELPSDDISSLLVDPDGSLWIGTSRGLARFKEARWTRYSSADGLASDSIAYLLDDDRGHLWLGSNKGLMQIARQELHDFATGRLSLLRTRTFGPADGLPTASCSSGAQPAACRRRDGSLAFPTINGLVTVHPDNLRPNTNPPPVIIESVLIEGTPLTDVRPGEHAERRIIVPARREHVEIRYTGLNLGGSERARFRYQLQGHETDWTQAGNVRVAHYSRLPAGDYRFVVSACNEDGVWNEAGASLALTVLPPYWATWWFRTATAILILGIVGGIVFYLSTQRLQRQLAVMKQQEALEKERARIARDIHDQLGASLTQLALLGELVETDKESPPDIEGHARQICQTARDTTRTLDEIVWTVNPSNDTLEGVVNYVCKYAQEYLSVAGLRYRLEIPPDLPEASIAPEVRHNIFLAAKEAVTNIVRHARATSAWLRLNLEPDRFTLEIADDGRGLAGMDAQRAATRNGLTNMRKRMEDVGGGFEFIQRAEGGTIVRLSAPLRRERPNRTQQKPERGPAG
jgi:ligand-binding sensor domain-containing protein/signal transduction histidine kinase